MPHISLHGLPISWLCERGAPDPVADLLGALWPVEAGEPQSGGVSILVRAASESAAESPDAEGCSPVFFQGVVQAYRGGPGADDAFLLWDRASRVRVPLDGSPIVADIAPASREVVPGSAAIMLHIALAIALRREGLFHLHAAALAHPSGAGVLVAGGSGAGKTTTAIALIEAGYAYLGDDTLFFRPAPATSSDERQPSVEILAFPREFHVGPATLRANPRLKKLARPRAGYAPKLALDPRRAFPGRHRLALSSPRVALFPSIADAHSTEMAPLSKADAFGRLLASSAAILIDGVPRRAENITLLQTIVEGASCHEIRLGRDVLDGFDGLDGPDGPVGPTAAIAPHLERILGKC